MMRLTGLMCAGVLAIGCLGCGDKMGWGAIGTRDTQAEQAPPAARGKEVRELCAQVKTASSALCNDMNQLKKKKAAAKH